MIITLTQIITFIVLLTNTFIPIYGFILPRHTYINNSQNFLRKIDTYRNRLLTHLESHNSVNSHLLGILNERSKNTNLNSPRLISQHGLTSKLSSGIYAILPLGNRIFNRMKRMINVEMTKLNAVELTLPILQPKLVLEDKLKSFGLELFRVKDRDKLEYYLSPSCEDLCCHVIKGSNFPLTKSQLPLCVYQINTKFRDEVRVSEVYSRIKEFLMLDAYSFHSNEDCANVSYTLFLESFKNMLNLLGLKYKLKEVNEKEHMSHELRVTIASKDETSDTSTKKTNKDQDENDIEVAHLFKFGNLYSIKNDLKFEGKDRIKEDIYMNSYGIGLNRLLNALVQNYSDEFGSKLPQVVAPYDISIISCNEQSDNLANNIKKALMKKGLSVLLDDRDDSIKNKMEDSKSIGIPHMILISDKFQKMRPNNIHKDILDGINKNSKVSNYYNLYHSTENIIHKQDVVNLKDYMEIHVEYHPRVSKYTYILKIRDLLNVLNIS